MKIKNSQIAAAAAVVGFVVWAVTARMDTAQADAPPVTEQQPQQQERPRVETLLSNAQPYDRQTVLQGQLEAWRSVELRARVAGTVELLPVALGAQVKQGQTLLSLSRLEYQAQLQSAQAAVRLKEAELKGARKLYKTNLQTETAVLRLESELENARATQVMAEQQLKHALPVAPFTGVVDQLDAELGQYMTAGEVWGRLVNIDRLKVTAQVPQQEVSRVAVGQPVDVQLLDGRGLQGRISFIASAADAATRSFPVEVLLENPQGLRIAGASATLNIHLGRIAAHKLSPALLSLNENGTLGVKWVNAQDQVMFQPVELLSTGTDGAWVAGLPEQIQVISLGGGFVRAGEQVQVVAAGGNR